MSEASLAPSSLPRTRPTAARGRQNRLNALEALERGFTLFRATFAREGWRYYAGAAPVVFCFIPMWVINGQIRISNGGLIAEALLLAGTYLLRVWMVANYMERVRERAYGVPGPRLASLYARLAALGRLIAWKITLSASALATLPTVAGASWFYSACQFASLEAREDGAERNSMGGCLALASQWFGGGSLLLMMLVPLWIAVWLNGFILTIMVPSLLHSIFGVNTLLSTRMGMFALLRSSAFWLALFAGAWLALDPIVKCTFVIVYQHLRSRREGDDLLGLLAVLPRERQKRARMMESESVAAAGGRVMIGALVVMIATLTVAPQVAAVDSAQAPSTRSAEETAGSSTPDARVQKLRQALDTESQRAIYRWHDAEHPSPPTWFDKLLAKIGQSLQRAWNAIWNFLGKLWPKGLNLSTGDTKRGWRLKDLRLWLALIAIFTVGVGVLLLWLRRGREAEKISVPMGSGPLPDLSNAAASERSEDEWFTLAAQLEAQSDLRQALRALYLGLLAGLAQRQWLTIRRDRTNREYLDEFTRKWRRRPQAALEARSEIPEKLRGSLRQFDRVWYGAYALTPVAVAAYRQDQLELLNRV
jgi:Domain of unknown function (DUF4129)